MSSLLLDDVYESMKRLDENQLLQVKRVIDSFRDAEEDMSEEDIAAVNAMIDQGRRDYAAGRTVSGEELFKELRARRNASA